MIISGQIKLVLEGPDNNHGRVLFQYNGEFGTICDDSPRFDHRQAKLAQVVCRMNGYRLVHPLFDFDSVFHVEHHKSNSLSN